MEKMSSSKPYLIRAIYEWIVANECTPYLVIDAEKPNVQVPQDHIEDGRIVMNISPVACQGLHIENDRVVFSARFDGGAEQIFAPPSAIIAIYAKENGRGMAFGDDDDDELPPSTPDDMSTTDGKPKKGRPNLTVVK